MTTDQQTQAAHAAAADLYDAEFALLRIEDEYSEANDRRLAAIASVRDAWESTLALTDPSVFTTNRGALSDLILRTQ